MDGAVSAYSSLEQEAADEANGEDYDEGAVPTEFLQEDASATLELPPTTRAPSLAARVIASRPSLVLKICLGVAALSTLWISIGGTLILSVNEELLEAADDPLVRHHDTVMHLGDFSSAQQIDEHDAGEAEAADRRRRLSNSSNSSSSSSSSSSAAAPATAGRATSRVCSPNEPRTYITLLYEGRGGTGGAASRNLLQPERLEAIHSLEYDLKEWLDEEGICWADEACNCLPFDSIASYLYPQILEPSSHTPYLLANGHALPRPVCAPSYDYSGLSRVLKGWKGMEGGLSSGRSRQVKVAGGGCWRIAAAAAAAARQPIPQHLLPPPTTCAHSSTSPHAGGTRRDAYTLIYLHGFVVSWMTSPTPSVSTCTMSCMRVITTR